MTTTTETCSHLYEFGEVCRSCGEPTGHDHDRWQKFGVHWHLYAKEHAIKSRERFSGTVASMLNTKPSAVARTPQEAAHWIAQREAERGRESSQRTRAFRLHQLLVGHGAATSVYSVGSGSVLDIWAVATSGCTAH